MICKANFSTRKELVGILHIEGVSNGHLRDVGILLNVVGVLNAVLVHEIGTAVVVHVALRHLIQEVSFATKTSTIEGSFLAEALVTLGSSKAFPVEALPIALAFARPLVLALVLAIVLSFSFLSIIQGARVGVVPFAPTSATSKAH